MNEEFRIIVLGIDGLSPLLVEKWMDALPNFRRMKEEGILGVSIPPCPAQTPVAWTKAFRTEVSTDFQVYSVEG